MQSDTPGRYPHRRKGGAFNPTDAPPIDPYLIVRVFGGRLAACAPTVDQLQNQQAFKSRTAPRNGLRPRWDEDLVAISSHPELAILHIEVRTKRRGVAGRPGEPVAFEAIPLCALRTGHRTLPLRDPKTGARLQFARLHVHIGRETVRTPQQLAPVQTLLRHVGLSQFVGAFEKLGCVDIDALDKMPPAEIHALLTDAAEAGGVGMSRDQALVFTAKLAAWRHQCAELAGEAGRGKGAEKEKDEKDAGKRGSVLSKAWSSGKNVVASSIPSRLSNVK